MSLGNVSGLDERSLVHCDTDAAINNFTSNHFAYFDFMTKQKRKKIN